MIFKWTKNKIKKETNKRMIAHFRINIENITFIQRFYERS